MTSFAEEFIEAINTHCVGKTIVSVEANGTFEDQQHTWIHLEDGTKVSFYTGASGCDSDTVYAFLIERDGTEIVTHRRYPPSPYDGVHDKLSILPPSTPPVREGFVQARGQTIGSAYFSGDALGIVLDSGMHLLSHTAGYVLYATWLYKPSENNQFVAVAKSITGQWRYASGFGLSVTDEHKRC